MKKIDKILHYFAETELPIMVSEDYLSEFERINDPFPQAFIDEIIQEWEIEIDDYTEFIPCFKLPKQEKFQGVVYWKGGVLKYDFILVTLNLDGELINKKAISSTIVENNLIKKSIASIEKDLIINIIAGQSIDGSEYDANESKAFAMEILPDGQIIFNLEE